MKTVTDHSSKMAETLRELSAYPVPASSALGKRPQIYKTVLAALSAVLLLAAGAAFVLRSETLPFDVAPTNTVSLGAPSEAMQQNASPQLSVSTTVPAAREITGSGYVIAPRRAVVYAEQGGLIVDILVAPGDRVAKSQPLLLIQDTHVIFALENARLALDAARLSLTAARISAAQADATLQRRAELARRGAIASNQLEDSQTAARMAINSVEYSKAEVATAELAVRIAEDRVSDLTVRAPISGTVTQISAHVGDAVLDRIDAIHDGSGLMTIADLDHLEIDADVTEKAISLLGEDVFGEAVLDASPDHPFPFVLQRVAPEVNAAKGTVRLRLKPIDPPSGLRPGMAARVRIDLPSSPLVVHAQSGVKP
jgi:RND family efflux transporter MFP subunit